MSSSQGDPIKHGEVVGEPPHKTTPPETGYTPFWEKVRGLLYVPNAEVSNVNLSIGSFVKFKLKPGISPTGTNFEIAYDISNF